MARGYSVAVGLSVNVGAVVARTINLFEELVGFDGEVLEPTFHEHWDVGPPRLSPPIPTESLGEFEIGFGRPSFMLRLRIGHWAAASAGALTDYDTPEETEADVGVDPDTRSGASHVLAACAVIAIGELADGKVYAQSFVGERESDAATLLAALRRNVAGTGSIEERARRLLRPLPGFRTWGLIQQPAE